MRRPDFFILGAPKAGTTALSRYLGEHARIFMCNPKEPFYFCSDFSGLPGPRTEKGYLDLFARAGEDALAVGEASAMYLYSRLAPKRIREFAPDSRVVVALRSPVDLAVSFHAQQLYGLSEDEPDFERAWRLRELRRSGQSLPRLVREPSFLQYESVSRLGEQVERVLSIFDRRQVHFVVFDDLSIDPGRVYRALLEFLEVPDDGRESFPRVNERKQNRSALLGRFLHRPPQILTRASHVVKRLLGRPDMGFLDGIRRRNAKGTPRRDLPRELRSEMCEVFRDDVSRLSDLVGRDLMKWVED